MSIKSRDESFKREALPTKKEQIHQDGKRKKGGGGERRRRGKRIIINKPK